MTYAIIAVLTLLLGVVIVVLVLTSLAFKRALQAVTVQRAALEDAKICLDAVAVAYVYPDDLSRLLFSTCASVEAALDDERFDEESEGEALNPWTPFASLKGEQQGDTLVVEMKRERYCTASDEFPS